MYQINKYKAVCI